MGVDWYACEKCGETFPDCGDFVRCECGVKWCSDECAEEDGYKYTYDEEENIEERSCKFCREEDFTDTELLEFILILDSVTRKELVEMYKLLKKAEE